MSYDLKSLHVPKVWGRALRTLVSLLESNYTNSMLKKQLLKEAGILHLRNYKVSESPMTIPKYEVPADKPEKLRKEAEEAFFNHRPDLRHSDFLYPSFRDYSAAYLAGSVTPTQIAEKTIQALDSQESKLNAVINFNEQYIRLQAEESTKRFEAGNPRSALEGVPVVVKDELDAIPYTTSVGTQVYGTDGSAKEDATVVERLKNAGAVIIGKANMHEMGIGVTGANPHFGVCRNPYDPLFHSGGSSSGSASAVAAGLCPIAVSADGGGSIRIPAALCGQVGLKATWSRVSEDGAAPLCWTLAHVGPIGATVDDVALGYLLMAGPDPKDPWSVQQPVPHLIDYLKDDLSDIKFGIYEDWFSHASKEVVECCRNATTILKNQGANEVRIIIDHLEAQRIAHVVTIGSEMLTAVADEYNKTPEKFALDTRINLALSSAFTSQDYVKAQRIRHLAIKEFKRAFEKVDVIITPCTGITAPEINEKALPDGESDLTSLNEIMRFAIPGNLAGLPAISVPVGYTSTGLPIGLQIIGRAWEEHTLLRMARVLEQHISRIKPQVYYDLLGA